MSTLDTTHLPTFTYVSFEEDEVVEALLEGFLDIRDRESFPYSVDIESKAISYFNPDMECVSSPLGDVSARNIHELGAGLMRYQALRLV